MVMPNLIQEWIAQWLGLRDRLRSPRHEADAWWLHIRERILRFIVSRYLDASDRAVGSDAASTPESDRPPPLPLEARRTFCRADASDAYGPRKCAELEGKLRSVSRINSLHKRPRWRWL